MVASGRESPRKRQLPRSLEATFIHETELAMNSPTNIDPSLDTSRIFTFRDNLQSRIKRGGSGIDRGNQQNKRPPCLPLELAFICVAFGLMSGIFSPGMNHVHVGHYLQMEASKSRFLEVRKTTIITNPEPIKPPPPYSLHDIKTVHLKSLPDNKRSTSDAIHDNDASPRNVLTAFLEPPTSLQQKVKALPLRATSQRLLKKVEFSHVRNCSRFMRDFASVVDWFASEDSDPKQDAFLPWIHDFFPTGDGSRIMFVAQNRRNCQTGKDKEEVLEYFKPQIALFQPIPIVSLEDEATFRLAHSNDTNTTATRFLCHFHDDKNISATTLSEFNFNYEFVTWRKRKPMIDDTYNQSPFWMSQLLFSCPVPPQFQERIRLHQHVNNDETNIFVDIVPIRTPARSNVLLTQEQVGRVIFEQTKRKIFNLTAEFGTNHVLPAIVDSGRWANLPICLPPEPRPRVSPELQQVMPEETNPEADTMVSLSASEKKKPHRLVACTWTSASYQRRGNAQTVSDSPLRLREWILFHKLVGFDHLYVYDNSPPIDDAADEVEFTDILKSVTEEFSSDFVTHIQWPCKICNNNRPMYKNPGDRSSQYGAEASCRERYGPYTDWMAFIDTDEYLVPMMNDTWEPLLSEMDEKGVHVLKLKSSRGLPRHDLMESLEEGSPCNEATTHRRMYQDFRKESCQIPHRNQTFLRVYNCDYVKRPRPDRFARAMKQIYRPDYVLSHYVHYSTVTQDIARYHVDQPHVNDSQPLLDWQKAGEAHELFLDELVQGALVHARSVLPHETIYRSSICFPNSKIKCSLGYVCPESTEWIDDKEIRNPNPFLDEKGEYCNCWINENVENVIVPKLEVEMRRHHDFISNQQHVG